MKKVEFISLVLIFFFCGCNPVATLVEPSKTPFVTFTRTSTLNPTVTITYMPTITRTPTNTPLPTVSPLVQKLNPGTVVMHPSTESNPYVFYSYFPRSATREKNIVVGVWPHGGNKSNDDYEYHKEQARNSLGRLIKYAEKYKVPLIVAAIPRIEGLYVHSLHPGTFLTTRNMLQRPDIKLIDAVWGQYIPSLRNAGFNTNDKVFMLGFSSPGMFTHRFAMLHPALVQAIWEGSEAPAPLPLKELNGTTLNYPLGVNNIETLTGEPFDLDTYLQIHQLITVGADEVLPRNDTTNYTDIFTEAQSLFIRKNFGRTNPERIRFFYKYLISIGAPAEFRFYLGIGHEITNEMLNDVFQFLVAHPPP